MNIYAFPLSILLAKGEKLALALIYLGSFTLAWMSLLAMLLGHDDVVTHAETSFL